MKAFPRSDEALTTNQPALDYENSVNIQFIVRRKLDKSSTELKRPTTATRFERQAFQFFFNARPLAITLMSPSQKTETDLSGPTQPNEAREAFNQAFFNLNTKLLMAALALGADPDWTLPVKEAEPFKVERPALIQTLYRDEPESVDFLKVLLESGASLFDGAFLTALLHCCCASSDSVIKKANLLLAHGDDIHFKDRYGRNSVHMASWRTEDESQQYSPPLLRLLAGAGADLGVIDQRGVSPMDLAIELSNLPAIETLWELGQRADVRKWELAYDSGESKANNWPQARIHLNALAERQTLSSIVPQPCRNGRASSL